MTEPLSSLSVQRKLTLSLSIAARDLAPRCFSFFIYGKEVFSARNYYWWIPVVAPVVGCLAGKGVWTLIVGEQDDDKDEEGGVRI